MPWNHVLKHIKNILPTQTVQKDVGPDEVAENVRPELAAAVSLALHMYCSSQQYQEPVYFFTPAVTPWVQQGRERIMNSRFATLNRVNRFQNR